MARRAGMDQCAGRGVVQAGVSVDRQDAGVDGQQVAGAVVELVAPHEASVRGGPWSDHCGGKVVVVFGVVRFVEVEITASSPTKQAPLILAWTRPRGSNT